LRGRPTERPFAVIRQQANTDRIYCLNQPAEVAGLRRGMALSNARILCSDLHTALADPHGDARFVRTLARWSSKYCPWVGSDDDGLVLDITGSAHLFGGESALLADIGAGLDRAGFDHADGMADTRGAAWALARFGGGIAQSGATRAAIAPLPVAALRIDETLCGGLRRLGLHTIGQVLDLPRATLARRFGAGLLLRLDQALGAQPEPVSPMVAPVNFSVRMTLPEPIGVASDVMAGLQRLLVRLCATLGAQEKGVRCLQFTARRVDQGASRIEVRFARPMRDPDRISRLFSERIDKLEAGFGIDQLRLEAVTVEPLPFRQTSRQAVGEGENMADLVTRLGSRVGMENITRYQPANSHIPENSFNVVPAA